MRHKKDEDRRWIMHENERTCLTNYIESVIYRCSRGWTAKDSEVTTFYMKELLEILDTEKGFVTLFNEENVAEEMERVRKDAERWN